MSSSGTTPGDMTGDNGVRRKRRRPTLRAVTEGGVVIGRSALLGVLTLGVPAIGVPEGVSQ